MSNKLYIAATEARSGKSAISLGVMELLFRQVQRVAFFRPIITSSQFSAKIDNDIHLMANHYNLKTPLGQMYAYTTRQANELISKNKNEELIDHVINQHKKLEENYDFVLSEGTDYIGSTSSFEFDINAEIAKNLGCPVLLVASAKSKTIDEIIRSIEIALESLLDKGCEVMATIINQTNHADKDIIFSILKKNNLVKDQLLYSIPSDSTLGNPTMGEITELLNAEVLYGKEQLHRHVHRFSVAAMHLPNFLDRIQHGTLVIVPGDRSDVILGCLAALLSSSVPNISGLLLTGGIKPDKKLSKLIEGFPRIVPILSVRMNTFPSARKVDNVHAVISPDNPRKIQHALGLFERNVDIKELGKKIIATTTHVVTPKMFEYRLVQQARLHCQHIVLPEGEDERILKAAEILQRRQVVKLTLLGDRELIHERISGLGINLDGIDIISPCDSDYIDDFTKTYHELRKHRGITLEGARDIISDVSYFGTMMVHKGLADGMVSGAAHTTGDTIRPGFEFIKTKPEFSIVSSVFFMCLEDRVLVYGDCAVNPNPNAAQLADIAINSAQTAKIFDIEPIVAMLSYSSGDSGKGADVDIIREAAAIAKKLKEKVYPDLKLEGPMQYDTAVSPDVAQTKMPDSDVAGKATVFIFPDLNTGNNTYKAVQRSAGAVAIGPILQGLRKPINDLSRGCTIPDIVNTVAITAIQAQAEKGLL